MNESYGKMMNKHLLVIDDEENMQLMYKKVLSKNGLKVDTADGAVSALALIAQNNYDLLIVDMSMASLNGIELLTKIQEMFQNIPSIMITGFPSIYAARRCRELGVLEYLTKPIDIRELNAIVNSALLSASA